MMMDYYLKTQIQSLASEAAQMSLLRQAREARRAAGEQPRQPIVGPARRWFVNAFRHACHPLTWRPDNAARATR